MPLDPLTIPADPPGPMRLKLPVTKPAELSAMSLGLAGLPEILPAISVSSSVRAPDASSTTSSPHPAPDSVELAEIVHASSVNAASR